jgi:hypothetical protein
MAGRRADHGWVLIAGFVVGHNVLHAGRGDEMLSEAFDRYLLRHPGVGACCCGSGGAASAEPVAGLVRPAGCADGRIDEGCQTSAIAWLGIHNASAGRG